MRRTASSPTHPARAHNRTARALFLTAAILGCVLFFPVHFAHASDPITVNTVVSRSGALWNAPRAAEPYFPTYSPPPGATIKPTRYPLPERAAPAKRMSPAAPGSVIGHDARTRITDTNEMPYRAIVFLTIDYGAVSLECTGFLIGPHTVATAGHCVRDPGLGWAIQAHAYAALNGKKAPYPSAHGVEFYTVTGWIETFAPEFDYGAIQLDTDLGTRTGWLGMSIVDKTTLQKMSVRVTGYPADKPFRTMWTMAGPVARVTPLRLYYAIDTYAGQSGSPVYNAVSTRSCMFCVVGIHGYGINADPQGSYNSGVRITPAVLNNYAAWRKLP